MIEALSMGKYGFYVWTSYGAFVAFLLWDWLAPRWQRRRLLRDIQQRERREAARQKKQKNA
ncbi:MAG: heme exporter protein CcmD [Rhodanobacteraceae bacterium]|nr:heme exporter protein CcmD [Xanthomonadales bacterium]MCP5478908.1 heme exporter protein CcmD [Rhodanobacteraceae bacterium]HPF73540.1 heme exporter protein CcmD [Xanthomonadaceae bacterium]HRY00015.1 heme exporter protein CcmD [Xanthomonadaceae bacterium]